MDGAEGEEAIEELCRRYWFPLSAFRRGRGCAKAEAEDVTVVFGGQCRIGHTRAALLVIWVISLDFRASRLFPIDASPCRVAPTRHDGSQSEWT